MILQPERKVDEHFLFPSVIHVASEACRVQTILGSCVAVCLYDQRRRVGGINHYMVPIWNGDGMPSPKYGDIVIDMLVTEMERMGCVRKDLVAKIFGGASQLDFSENVLNVGIRNIELALTMLERHRIFVAAQSVGGTRGRKIVFRTDTGQVLMKFIEKSGG